MTNMQEMASSTRTLDFRMVLLVLALSTLQEGCLDVRSSHGADSGPPTQPATLARPISEPPPQSAQPWPGFGTATRGGLDGGVVRVTNLKPDGPGSLRRALYTTGPRLVVFEVGGVIDLEGRSLSIRNPYLTLAGQTAPDPGITLIRGSLIVETHDVVVQHLAVRPGDRGPAPAAGEWTPDALGARRGEAGPVHDVVFDHCSATWAIDENLSTSGPADVDTTAGGEATSHDITLRSCLIAEGLSHAGHPKGEHSKGTLVHDGVRNVAILGCLYAHNHERNPRLKGGTRTVVANNVMYDWSSACIGIGKRGNAKVLQPAESVVVGNVAIGGTETHGRTLVKSIDPGGRAYLRDNFAIDAQGSQLLIADDEVVPLDAWPAWAPALPRVNAVDVASSVLRSAGARPARRDPIDARIVRSVIEGTGRIIDSQEQVGGYPDRPQTTQSLSVPEGADARREWLATLSAELNEDRELDVTPLLGRLAGALPSPPATQTSR